MKQFKTHITIMALVSLSILGIAAAKGPDPRYKNLQILPKDISERKMDSIMESYSVALGVTCSFCHDPVGGFPDSLNYATDKNEMKENARQMMRMTIEMNTKYFNYDKTVLPVYLNTVHCNMCHRGDAFPEY